MGCKGICNRLQAVDLRQFLNVLLFFSHYLVGKVLKTFPHTERRLFNEIAYTRNRKTVPTFVRH